jgi:hypothetical protein
MYNVHYLTTEIYDTYLISSSWFFFNSVVRVFFCSSVEFWRLLEKFKDIKDVIRNQKSQMTYNTKEKRQIMIHKTLRRKIKILQHEP